ncbi:hypothetical protein Tco_0858175 [Tanacetum coccineum]|uniref:Hybrid signal transduction histidine kinase M n=1 Tax=Tanacetum coccineum TaxID=301880 RepID=A0ABQ5BCF6_9ASTR
MVVEHTRPAKEAWHLITDIFKDNKHSHTIALKAELPSRKLGDLTIDVYIRKIESIATILTTLGSPVSSEDVVTFALKGLPDKYDHLCGIIKHREPFSDLKMARLMLTTEETRLRSKSLSLPVDCSSSSPMVLMAETGYNRNIFNVKGSGSNDNGHYTNDLLVQPTYYYPTASPPGFVLPQAQPNIDIHLGQSLTPQMGPMIYPQLAQPTGKIGQPIAQLRNAGTTALLGQATTLPHAFNSKLLQDPTSSA